MIISKIIFDIIKNSTMNCSYEIGGILGSSNGKVIDNVVIDKPSINTNKCYLYEPNVEYLNQNIELWQKKDIVFKGLFHTHFSGSKNLSDADIEYIKTIMLSSKGIVEYLYFPLFTLPDNELTVYKAYFRDDEIVVDEDELIQIS